jgi:ABC-2 type transport system ATP-binding protein
MQEVFLIKYLAMFEVRNIGFSRGGCRILSGVTFSVSPGEVLALTGANGAGKTTLLKVLAGIWLPTSGTAFSDGADILKEPIRHRRHLGWLGEAAPADDDLTVKAYLKYRAKLKGEQSRKIRHRVREAMSICGLDDIADVVIGTLSRGQRKRVALADAVILRPRLLLLDDVFAGLDDKSREAVVSMIASFRVFAAVVVSGHETEWFARLGARVIELKGGCVS